MIFLEEDKEIWSRCFGVFVVVLMVVIFFFVYLLNFYFYIFGCGFMVCFFGVFLVWQWWCIWLWLCFRVCLYKLLCVVFCFIVVMFDVIGYLVFYFIFMYLWSFDMFNFMCCRMLYIGQFVVLVEELVYEDCSGYFDVLGCGEFGQL